ncbi:hypothetical protein TNCT_714831 [Trichonephila clavata]|uniref:Uncharacterized protein n=1 Tax=Trichonephila clavata TaxID=2740835 RepID=A0A8X6HHT0_TRICU|nr:hypothetical protein TNCT_714831 [Trichonephila clavata]
MGARHTCSRSEMFANIQSILSNPLYIYTIPSKGTDSVIMEDPPPEDPLDHCHLLSEREKNVRILEMRARLYKDYIHEEEKFPSANHPLNKDIWSR